MLLWDPRPRAQSPWWTQRLLETRLAELPVWGQPRSTMRRLRRNISVLLLSDLGPNQEVRGSVEMRQKTLKNIQKHTDA